MPAKRIAAVSRCTGAPLRKLGGILLGLCWLGFSTEVVCAEPLPFTASRFVPAGVAGRAALLGADIPDPQAISREVARRGFYADEPLSATECTSCHGEIAAQWAQSAHRFSSFNNPYYAAAVDLFRVDRALPKARFCAGCHDPLLLVDDTISQANLPRDTLTAQAGLPCLICHSIFEDKPGGHAGKLGNGAYVLRLDAVPPPRSEAESANSSATPSAHGARLRPPLLQRPELCATCHRVGLSPDIIQTRWLRGQDDYGPWLASVAAGNGIGAVYRPEKVEVKRCQDCHMPLEPLRNGKLVRSHRFLGANTALPNLREDAEAFLRTREFLRGAVSLDVLILPPASPRSDERPRLDAAVQIPRRGRLHFDVVLRNRRVGHRFPSGTNDSNDVWVEVAIASSGSESAPEGLADATHLVRAQPVDEHGEPLLRRDPQNTRGVIYNTSLSPADPQVIRYVADLDALPAAQKADRLTLSAKLRYRKFSRDYAHFACASLPKTVDPAVLARCQNLPVIDIASAERTLLLKQPAPPKGRMGSAKTAAQPANQPAAQASAELAPNWQRYLDHGLGLADGLVDEANAARPSLLAAVELAKDRPEPYLGLARLALALGRTDEVLAAAARAEALRANHPAHLYLRGLALYRTYRFAEARPFFERAALLLPGDPNLLGMLARVRGLDGDVNGALSAADRLLALEPESEEGHHQRMLALRELNRLDEAAIAEQRYLYYRRPIEVDQDLRQLFRARHPERDQEDVLAHTHMLHLTTPLSPNTPSRLP